MHRFINISIIALLLFSSCTSKKDNNIIIKEFQNEEWSRFELLEGDMDIKDVPVKFDVIMEVVVSDKYPSTYELHQKNGDFLFNLTVLNSNGTYRTNEYKFKLKNNEGYWNADKKDGFYTFRLPVINEMTLSDSDTYKFVIENKYSKDPLQGIKSLILKYENYK